MLYIGYAFLLSSRSSIDPCPLLLRGYVWSHYPLSLFYFWGRLRPCQSRQDMPSYLLLLAKAYVLSFGEGSAPASPGRIRRVRTSPWISDEAHAKDLPCKIFPCRYLNKSCSCLSVIESLWENYQLVSLTVQTQLAKHVHV